MRLVTLLVVMLFQSQPPIRLVDPTNTNPLPSDLRMQQFDMPEGATWRVFGVDSFPDGPVKIVQVAEVRQQNPPSSWSVHVTNRALMLVNSVSLAAAGLGTLIASLVTSPDQGNLIGSIVSMMMGLFGGVFFSVQQIPILAPLSRLTIVYWATDAFSKLSLEQGDIGLNLAILLVIGAVFFASGWAIFNRRMNV